MAIATMNPKKAKVISVNKSNKKVKGNNKSKAAKAKAKAHHQQHNKKVSFSNVQVRMYPVTLGISPGGVAGPPLSLSWQYTSLGKASVDDFELHRTQCKRRPYRELHISPTRRVALLRSAGFSDAEIYQAAHEAAQDRLERRQSLQHAILACRALKAAQQQQQQQQLQQQQNAKPQGDNLTETGQAALLHQC